MPECCPAEDGKRRSAGRLSSAWKSGGILPCVDQKQARPAPVSRAWTPEGENGNAVGLPHLQSATVDPFAKTANRASHRLDSENAKAKKPRVKIAAWIEQTSSSHAPQKTAGRAVSSQLRKNRRVGVIQRLAIGGCISLFLAEGEIGGTLCMRSHISVHRATTKYFSNSFVFKNKIEKEGLPRDSPAGLGAGGPEFESRRPDQNISRIFFSLLKALFTHNSSVEFRQTGGLNSQIV
jgi:hypothetical protein